MLSSIFFQYSCMVMEYCPGGDLLTLIQRQPDTRFPLPSAKFYAAEVLVALEYLHMMELLNCNAGSIMDKYHSRLSLPNKKNNMKPSSSSSSSSPSASAILLADIQKPEVQLWDELTDAQLGLFVGTREYLAQEVIRGLGDGNGVDWWAFGPVTFPRICTGYEMGKAHDFIRKLLVKDPNKRTGSLWGAVEIKRHFSKAWIGL
ncbi:hypothetical protein F3Y22_tig00116997pilonHSYRG00673 [Hibiscus syriacus]|uniref:non-specific serine/threonine protein kinase n=1 Tax=Hibiscus syriacus TaxID=106335 RepID=A0A6A2X4M4_HIBSY|nr:hypothetical protein F3Y22_tig00116997pilonHSYRG00673 [Hibiscus syriacus]